MKTLKIFILIFCAFLVASVECRSRRPLGGKPSYFRGFGFASSNRYFTADVRSPGIRPYTQSTLLKKVRKYQKFNKDKAPSTTLGYVSLKHDDPF